MSSEKKVDESFLSELKYTFEQGLSWKNSLDSKANNMIAMSSAVSTFLITIVTFLFSKININNSSYSVIISFLLIAIISAIIAILYFIKSYSIKDYFFPVGHEAFFENGKYSEENVNEILSFSKEEFNENLIEEYLECMKINAVNINNKAAKIKYGQYFYFASIVAIIVILIIIFFSELYFNNKVSQNPSHILMPLYRTII
jgi:hypothetical protein